MHESLEKLDAFCGPVLLSKGYQTPRQLLTPVVERFGNALEDSEITTFQDAGHIHHVAHPEMYADAVKAFFTRYSG